jgi:hypothetical protein
MPRFNLHGELLADGKWSGIMGMLTRGEVDASCSDLTMTKSRLNMVDFIEPVWADRCVCSKVYHIQCYPNTALW